MGVITSDISCQWGQIFFHVSISTRRSRFILWVLQLYTHLKYWSSHSPRSNSYSILRVCSPMRANVILRGNSNYQFVFNHPVYWRRSCSVNMGRLCRRQRNSNSLFSLHFILPFVIAGIAGVHLLFLHQTGSNNPLGLNGNYDKIPFHRFLTSKDLFGFFTLFVFIRVICFFYP